MKLERETNALQLEVTKLGNQKRELESEIRKLESEAEKVKPASGAMGCQRETSAGFSKGPIRSVTTR